MRTQQQINEKRAELERQLAELDDEEQELASLTPEQRLAEALHSMQCHQNHTDMCSWGYEDWSHTGEYSAHGRYLEKAKKVMALLPTYTPDQILEIAEALR